MKNKIFAVLLALSLLFTNAQIIFAVQETTNPNPINFMCSSSDNFLIISWKNPTANNIASIKLFDVTGQKTELVPISPFNTTANAYNNHKVAATNGMRNIYSLEIKYQTGEDVIVETSGIPLNGGHQVAGWTTHTNWNQETVADIDIQGDVTHSGNGALIVRGNQGVEINSHFVKIYQDLSGLDSNKTYECKFWAKGKKVNHLRAFLAGEGSNFAFIGAIGNQGIPEAPTEWKEFTVGVENATLTSRQIGFHFDGTVESEYAYIDDVRFYDVANPSVNLLANGDFEQGLDGTAPAEITTPTGIYNESGKIELNWTNPVDSDFEKVNIYQKEGNDLYYRKSIFGGTGAIFDELTLDKKYTYVVKTVDKSFNESVGTEISPEKVKIVPYNPNPTNFMCSAAGGHIIVSWRNPDNANIKSLDLYDVTDGKKIPLTSGTEGKAFSTGAKAFNKISLPGLTNGKRYVYRLVTKYQTGEDVVVETSGVPSAEWNKINDWNLIVNNGDVTVGDVRIQTRVAHSGKGALLVRGNQGEAIPNSFIKVFQNLKFLEGDYTWSFWMKAKNLNHIRDYFNGPGNYHKIIQDEPGTWDIKTPNEWTKIEYKGPLKVAETQELGWIFDSFLIADECYIDDIVITKDGGDGKNLVLNGDFEAGLDTIAPGAITNVTASAKEGTANFTWTKPLNEDYLCTNIYEKINGKLVYRKSVFGDASSTTLEGLVNGKEYTYVLTASDSIGNESPEASVLVTSVPPVYEANGFRLYDGKIPIEVVKTGKLTVKTTVKNNSAGNNFKPLFMVNS
ncbi:MAG: hypothetical protein RSA27_01780 [Oscillospiraceae bacterium]